MSNPDELRAFLTQKGAKNMFLRQCCLIKEWLYRRIGTQRRLCACNNKLGTFIEMEEKIMFTKIIGAIIGALVFGAGIYYLLKEKDDKEARKIYTIISV